MAGNNDPMGLANAYGAGGAADTLRQLIIDKFSRQMQEQQAALQERHMALLEQQAKQQAEDRAAALAEKVQAERDAAAGRSAPLVGMGGNISFPQFAKTYAGTSSEQLFEPQQTLGARTTIGGQTLPNVPSSQSGESGTSQIAEQTTQQAPRSYTGRLVMTGTPAQKADEEKQRKQAALLANPSLSPLQRIQMQAEEAGLKPPTVAPENANAEDRRYENIIARRAQQLPIAPDEAAWAGAYEKRKTLGTDTSSAAALARQSQQDLFMRQQAGRSELTNKIEQPYLDAKEKADTLRNVVQAAQGGNMVAGSIQPLLATLGVVTMEGVKRINSVELNQVAGAGSLWDRIKGQAGKLTAGQPMDAALQKDLIDLSNMLERSARKKYLQGHSAVKGRYQLSDESPLPEGESAPASAPNRVRYDINGNRIP